MLKPMVTLLGLIAVTVALAQSGAPAALPAPITPPGGYTPVTPTLSAQLGAKLYQGVRKGYAYVMEVPANWNGGLVMYAHGFAGLGAALHADPIPIRTPLVAGGFAWAASSYSANGWAVREGSDDTLDLAGYFAQVVKPPKATYLIGASMGGNVVSDSIEAYPNAYKAAMPVCGALTGIGLFDYYLAYGQAAQALTGLTWNANILGDPQNVRAVLQQAQPLLGSPGHYTKLGRQFDSLIANLSGGPRPFRLEGLNLQFGGGVNYYQAALVYSPLGIINLAPGAAISSNSNTVYRSDPALGLDDAAFNKLVRRLPANAALRALGRSANLSAPTGKIGIPVLSLHTTGDPYVPIFTEQDYRRLVEAAGKGNLLVQRAIRRPGHCEFTGEELLQGFYDLVAWANGGPKPAGDDLLGPLGKVGLTWTKPLRADDPGGL